MPSFEVNIHAHIVIGAENKEEALKKAQEWLKFERYDPSDDLDPFVIDVTKVDQMAFPGDGRDGYCGIVEG